MENVKPELDKGVFWPAISLVVILVALTIIFPDGATSVTNKMIHAITFNLDWLIQLGGFAILIFLLWLAFGRFGKVKLGEPDEKPEFSTFSFAAMAFCTGIGACLVYWSIAEPINYLQTPPFGLASGSIESTLWPVTYTMFHWGITPWALFVVPAVPIAYQFYIRKKTKLRLSLACEGLLGKHVDGWVGGLIDILGIIGVIGGVGCALGIYVPMMSAAIADFFGIADTLMLKVVIIAIWTAIFGTSVYRGLHKGIQVLSRINVYAAFVFIAIVLFAGPTSFILSNSGDSLGVMLQNYLRMSFYTDAVTQSGFPQGWTVFYWCWWLAYLAMMGLFIARTARGRTIKEVVLIEMLCGTLGCWLFICVLGSYTVHLEVNNIVAVSAILTENGIIPALLAVVKSLPASKLVLFLFIFVEFIFMATTIDSGAYVMATMCTKNLTNEGSMEPARWHRIVWAIVLALVGLAALMLDGLKAVQSLAVVAGAPLLIIAVIVCVSLVKWLREDFDDKEQVKTTISLEPAGVEVKQ